MVLLNCLFECLDNIIFRPAKNVDVVVVVRHVHFNMWRRYTNVDSHMCGYMRIMPWPRFNYSGLHVWSVQYVEQIAHVNRLTFPSATPYNWGDWSAWSTCTGCGSGGSQTKSRSCLGSCGTFCTGSTTQSQSCTIGLPAASTHSRYQTQFGVSGTPYYWGAWNALGTCSAACGGAGSQTFQRSCSGTCGPQCTGSTLQTQTCQGGL